MRRRLFWSMLGVATLALFVVGVFGAVIGQTVAVRDTYQNMARQAATLENLIEEQFQTTIGSRLTYERLTTQLKDGRLPADSILGQRLLRLLTTAERLTGGRVVDLGWVTPSGDLHLVREPNLTDALGIDTDRLLDGEDVFVRRVLRGEREAVLAVAHPSTETGIVIVVMQRSTLFDWRGLFRWMLLAFALAVVLSAIAARLIAGSLAKRVGTLGTVASSLAEGDLSARAAVDGNDEVTDLARSFNDMADRLEQTQQGERDFLMSVGHDLRTPLTTIGGYAEALEEGGLDEAAVRRIGTVLTAETRRLRRLIEDLMLLARLDASEFTLRPEPVDVAAHLREVASSFEERARRAGVRFAVDLADTGVVEIDPDRLAQIVGNLLENALRYTPEAGTVRLSVRRGPGGLMVEVADSGPGIDPEDLPRVFDRFYVSRAYRGVRPEGSGLGLSIVKRLVDAMGGQIDVTSGDRGTTFTVTFG